MDPLTHGLFGAAAAQIRSRPEHIGWAALCGLIGGMFPDIDILIKSETNPLLQIQYHRHFTHALIFVPLGGLIVATALWPLLKKKLSFKNIFVYATCGMFLHGIIDATTSYGTHLFWPFTNRRESWSIMSIIDPLVTIPLLIAVLGYILNKQKNRLYAILAFVIIYFAFGGLQHWRVREEMFKLAESRNHSVEHYEVKPTLFNSLLWRTTYIADNRIYIDGIRSGVFGELKTYSGKSAPLFKLEKDLPNLNPNSTLAEDIKKFTFFSDQFVAFKHDDSKVIADMRYAMLPNDIAPLWGIRIDLANPDNHVKFENYRQRTPETLTVFWRQLKGED